MASANKDFKEQTGNDQPTRTADKPGKFGEQPWFEVVKAILIPVVLAGLGWHFTLSQAESAKKFTSSQTAIANNRSDTDSAAKESEDREKVLTEYATSISKLVLDNKLRENNNTPNAVKNLARGETLIALRRLNVSDKQAKDNDPKVDKGELKGLLIRYLFESKLINYNPEAPVIDLSGSDITKVRLMAAWLPTIHLKGAFLNEADFRNADLTRANLVNSRLKKADFTNSKLVYANLDSANLTGSTLISADLRFANLKTAILSDAKLKGACYTLLG